MTNVTRAGCFERSAVGAAKSISYSLSFPPLWREMFSAIRTVRSQIRFYRDKFLRVMLQILVFYAAFLSDAKLSRGVVK